MTTLRTVGHGTLSSEALTSLLEHARIGRIVDVRSFPGSRHNPQFRRAEMEQWVAAAGIEYVWMGALGGRRRPVPDSKHVALRDPGFRAYADHMETREFLVGVDALLEIATAPLTAAMCSESVWWRCHRRLIADYVTLVRGVDVGHLMHDGRVVPHVPTQGVRRVDDRLVYDAGTTPSLPLG